MRDNTVRSGGHGEDSETYSSLADMVRFAIHFGGQGES